MSCASRVVIAGSGSAIPASRLRRLVDAGDYLIAADGGADALYRAGFTPDVVIGDMDSISPSLWQRLGSSGAGPRIIRHPKRKDATDSELALHFALKLSPRAREILMLGVFGDRLDHSLGLVMAVAGLPQTSRRRITLSDGRQFARVFAGGLTIFGTPGDFVSLVPLTPLVEGVSLEGFSFPLTGEDLCWGNTLGISNQLVQPRGQISMTGRGVLLAIHTPAQIG